MEVLSNFFKALEADFDIFSKDASRQSFDDDDDSLEHPDTPQNDGKINSENKQEDNTNNEMQNTKDENLDGAEDDFDDLDDGMGDLEGDEEDPNTDPENINEEEPKPEEDSDEKIMKQRLKENFIYLYDILVSNVESMEGSKSFRPEFDTEKYLTVKNHLIQLKEIIYKIITVEFDSLSSIELQRKFNAAERTYDVATNMLEVYFNEGVSNIEKSSNKSTKPNSKKNNAL